MNPALQAPGVWLDARSLIALRTHVLNSAETEAQAALPGGFVTRRRGQGQEVADVRQYVTGDDIRHLDRGSTARTGVLHVRSFQEERDRVTFLVADFRPSMLWGTRRAFRSVAAAEALSLIGWRAIEEGGRVGLLAIGPKMPVVTSIRGRVRGMLAVIGAMARAHATVLEEAQSGRTNDPDLDGALARVTRLAPAGAEVVIASGFDRLGGDLSDRLGQLARRRHPRMVMVGDGIEALPPGSYPIRLADGSHRLGRIDQGLEGALPAPLAGFPLLRVDAAASVAQMARVINGGFPRREGVTHG